MFFPTLLAAVALPAVFLNAVAAPILPNLNLRTSNTCPAGVDNSILGILIPLNCKVEQFKVKLGQLLSTAYDPCR
jgi:hypothetical protein